MHGTVVPHPVFGKFTFLFHKDSKHHSQYGEAEQYKGDDKDF